jgi:hypothetical protein
MFILTEIVDCIFLLFYKNLSSVLSISPLNNCRGPGWCLSGNASVTLDAADMLHSDNIAHTLATYL